MKAFLINPEEQSIEAIDITSHDDIKKLIGFDTIIADEIGSDDYLYFDEECFLRGTSGRFQIDNLIPVSGKGIIIGANNDGADLKDITTDIDTLKNRFKYL